MYIHSISLEWTSKRHENQETIDWDSVISHYQAFIPMMLSTEVWVQFQTAISYYSCSKQYNHNQ